MKKVLFLIILTIYSSFIFSQTWVQKNNFTGDARSEALSFVINDIAYVGGGLDDNGYKNDFWKYDSSIDSWVQIADFPGSIGSGMVTFSIDGFGYIGLGSSGWPDYDYYDSFYKYNPNTDTWTQVADFAGTARAYSISFVIDNYAYIGTGKDASDEQNDFYKYDPNDNSWSALSSSFSGDKRKGATAFVISDKAYVVAGSYYDSYSVSLSDIQEYDPVSDTWSEKLSADGINLAFSGAPAFVINDEAFICYGNHDFVTKYNPATNTITNLGDVLNIGETLFSLMAFNINNKGYLGLGQTSEYLNEIYECEMQNNDATLSDLTIDGTSVDGFDPLITSYDVELPEETTEVPTVLGITNDSNANAETTDATSLPGTSTVLVTAEDEATQKTYSVNFIFPANTDATLSDLTIDGTSIDGFDPSITSYDVELPYGTTEVPTVVGITNDTNANTETIDATSLPGTSTVIVTAEDGTTQNTYFVNFTTSSVNIENIKNQILINQIANREFIININDNYLFEVLDINGEIIKKQTIHSTTNLCIENSGIFFFRFSNDKNKFVKKILVK